MSIFQSQSYSQSPLRQAGPSARKVARSPLKQQRHDSTARAHAQLADLSTLLEDFAVERESRMRAVRTSQAERVGKLERELTAQLAYVHDALRSMSLRVFVGKHGADEARAVHEGVHRAVAPKPMIAQEAVGRSRKRAAPSSPARTRRAQSTDPLGPTKKARQAPPSPPKPARVPSSASRRPRLPRAALSPSPEASDWDLMDRHEASRAEDLERSSKRPPTAATFTYAHPDAGALTDAYFRALQENLVRQMRDTLEGPAGRGMGRQERAKLEKRLADMTRLL